MFQNFLRRPQSNALRKALFQIHLWTGMVVAFYVVLIGITGSILVFRSEFQEATFPQFFATPRVNGRTAAPELIIKTLLDRYPDDKLLGLDFPTARRNTFLSYLMHGDQLRTVFSHPDTGEILGELPKSSWITILQDLHFDLLSGSKGRLVNGVGALSLVLMFATGLVLWWPGIARWTSSLWIEFSNGWRRITWDLHSAVGLWLFALLMMWAVSGVEFAFPRQFRHMVNVFSPLTVAKQPESVRSASQVYNAEPALWVAKAEAAVPGSKPGRVVWPSTDRAPIIVVMASVDHGDFDTSDEVTIYFDQYSGEPLELRESAKDLQTAGDLLMHWLGPVHVGTFGGWFVKILWALLGLSFPALAVTGIIMWWNRSGRIGFRS